ncbi:hypothetical protein N7509_006952 [Penicillium cosmopolitanum]|uniref:Uncharacterized protein n=1 Tax=Penicillium cosmopolitanum TaxID=1131564 RepID=A0A9X0B7X7_9EURO|nr:uncharacterized protein N7509_006952 [Penicillium cosmopolitanum]KAJ5391462.1 hypothetical protein N7509_006952 [Penicillium cosmopolitanum]
MNFIAPLLCGDIHVAHWQGPSPNSKKENLLSTIMKGSSYRYIQEKETLPHKQTREKSFIIVADQEVPPEIDTQRRMSSDIDSESENSERELEPCY